MVAVGLWGLSDPVCVGMVGRIAAVPVCQGLAVL